MGNFAEQAIEEGEEEDKESGKENDFFKVDTCGRQKPHSWGDASHKASISTTGGIALVQALYQTNRVQIGFRRDWAVNEKWIH
ncbi:unnamed protein product [Protopolystoma xenopodis]|uniref:Uncharacterized protein n=1 Tax=Protopolystoma xenopodis TaxID=117903 RepID=A0A3S5CSZ1_9PLAT|nr:unnamed protein product [Protopolystoma xenopodis]